MDHVLNLHQLEEWFAENGRCPHCVHDMDEKGCMLGQCQSCRVFVRRGTHQATSVQGSYCLQSRLASADACTADGNRELVTIIECCSADGTSITPCYILKGKSIQRDWTMDDPIHAHFACSDSGWNDNILTRYWIEEVFDPETKAKCPHGHGRRLLILDGFASHISYDFVEYALSHNIDLLCLPAHSSADLQPLDVGIFSPVATKWSQEVENYSRTYKAITKYDFAAYVLSRECARTPYCNLLRQVICTSARGWIDGEEHPSRLPCNRDLPVRAQACSRTGARGPRT
jgi:hypothetical protein